MMGKAGGRENMLKWGAGILLATAGLVHAENSFSKACILNAARRVAEWQLGHEYMDKAWGYDRMGKEKYLDWVYGPYLNGLVAMGQASGDAFFIEQAESIGEMTEWKVLKTNWVANDHASPQSWLELYELDKDPEKIEATLKALDEYMTRNKAGEGDLICNAKTNGWNWCWCDAFYMSPPAFARAAKVTGDKKYLAFLHDRWKASSEYFYSPEHQLHFRDNKYFDRKEANGQPVFWCRGNGWVIGGLVRVMQYLDKGDPAFPMYEKEFRLMAARLKELQLDHGLWNPSLLDPDSKPYPDTSGSALLLYGFAWGINEGLLPNEEYWPVVQKGWPALCEYVQPNGQFVGVQPIGEAPKGFDAKTSVPYGAGAYLLAASEVYKMKGAKSALSATSDGAADRAYTIALMRRIADPVLIPLSEERLNAVLPTHPEWERGKSIPTSELQAFGRTLAGMAPWLSLGVDETEEGQLRKQYIGLACTGLINAANPGSPDFMFSMDKRLYERIVHASYVAYALLVAPDQLWEPLTPQQRENVVAALKTHRGLKPTENNWLLFSAILECAIWKATGECDMEVIEYGVKRHQEWYRGDGTYSDGQDFHWDYYNSFVIHPLLLETLRVCKEKGHPLGDLLPVAQKRGERYAVVLEHMISPEGTFPVIGRSSTYRIAAFNQLGYSMFRFGVPEELEPGATRAALTTVIHRMMDAPGTFDDEGYLNPGIVGHQQDAVDYYNVEGALYFCALGLTHLGLPPDSPFWTEPAGKWFQQKVWSGDVIPNQQAYKEK